MPSLAFTPGETLARERRNKLVAENPDLSGAELIAAIDEVEQSTRHGQYFDVVTNEPYVWVDDAPEDTTDPSGHFERYHADQHGKPYQPLQTPEVPGTVISKSGGAGSTSTGGKE